MNINGSKSYLLSLQYIFASRYNYSKFADNTALSIQLSTVAAQIFNEGVSCGCNTIFITVNGEECVTPIRGVIQQEIVCNTTY